MPNEPQQDLVIEAREFLPEVTQERKSALCKAVTHRVVLGKAEWLIQRLCDEIERRDELIVHMYVHSGYRNNGYLQMTTPQKALYDDIWSRSVKALDEEEAKVDRDHTD